MQRKRGRLHARTRQKQKLSRRTIIIIAGSCMTCLVIGFTIFFNMSHVDNTMASERPAVKEFTMEDQHYVDDMTLRAPIVVERPNINATTRLMRPVKEIIHLESSTNK